MISPIAKFTLVGGDLHAPRQFTLSNNLDHLDIAWAMAHQKSKPEGLIGN